MQTKNINQNITTNNAADVISECRRIFFLEPQKRPETFHSISHHQTAEVEGSGPYKPVPPPKPLTGSQSPPPYRMPPRPLHNEPAIPGAPDQPQPSTPNLHTHSSKFPIEREVILSSADKNSKIPILNEYRKRPNSAIAPDAPHIQMAWIEEKNRNSDVIHRTTSQQLTQSCHNIYEAKPMTLLHSSQISELSPIRGQDQQNCTSSIGPMSTGAVPKSGPAHSTPETEQNSTSKAFSTRTYHTIRDIISSRFSKNKTEPCIETELNNAENNTGGSQPPKLDESLSPQSQLRQHGVYLGNVNQSPQQQVRTIHQNQVLSRNNEIMRRNQEIRDRHQQHQQQHQIQHQHQQLQQQYQHHQDQQTPHHQQNHMMHQHQHQQFNQQIYQPLDRLTDRVGEIQIEQTPRSQISATESKNQKVYGESRGLLTVASNSRHHLNDNETPVSRRVDGIYSQRSIMADGRLAKSQVDLVSSCNTDNQNIPAANLRYSNNNIPADVIRSGQVFSRLPLTPVTQYQNKEIKRVDNQRSVSDQKLQSQPTPNPRTPFITSKSTEEYTSRVPELSIYNGQPTPNSSTHPKGTKEEFNREPMRTDRELESHPQRDEYQSGQTYSSRENVNNAALSGEDDGVFGKTSGPMSGTSSDYDKLRNGGHSDSGRGSTVYSSGKAKTERQVDTSPELCSEPHCIPGSNENGWADMVENELRHILDPKMQVNVADSTISESISSMTPPLPPLSPTGSSDDQQPIQYKHKSLPYGSKPDYSGLKHGKTSNTPGPGRAAWSARVGTKGKTSHHRLVVNKRSEIQKAPPVLMSSSLDLDSMLDDNNSSDEESTTVDTHHTQTIRKQLEALENMYSEVLKLLGVRKNTLGHSYQPSDPRVHRRRLHGSMSSLPSSVSSRPIRDKHRRTEERKKVKDIRGINKRFQRLESHVVTLARSVAHLSSEMRTQHLMIQEMEVIRGELAALRTQSNMLSIRSHSVPCAALQNAPTEQVNSSPGKVKKLTKFFGEEPPLMKLFLEKLGYEKYAKVFEKERIGFVELPYLTEERLHKLGIPLGPRLRIMQEAQMGFPTFENTLCVL